MSAAFDLVFEQAGQEFRIRQALLDGLTIADIEQDDSRLYVEVEGRYIMPRRASGGPRDRHRASRPLWPAHRRGGRDWLKIVGPAGVAGIATDPVTLRRRVQQTLWVEVWPTTTTAVDVMAWLQERAAAR